MPAGGAVPGTARIGELEYLRGFAILAVVAVHVSVFFTEAARFDTLAAVNLAVYIGTHFAVPLFLFVSGVALTYRYSGRYPLRLFYRRRFLTIGPPYLLFSGLYLLLPAAGLLFLTGATGLPSSDAAVTAFLTGTAHYHLWFFILIAQFYLLFPLIMRGYAAAERSGAVPFLLLTLLFFQVLWNVGAHIIGAYAGTVWYSVLIRVFISHLFWFVLGIAALRNYDRFTSIKSALSWKVMLGVAVAVTVLLTANVVDRHCRVREFQRRFTGILLYLSDSRAGHIPAALSRSLHRGGTPGRLGIPEFGRPPQHR